MNSNFNKNEDYNKLLVTDLHKRLSRYLVIPQASSKPGSDLDSTFSFSAF